LKPISLTNNAQDSRDKKCQVDLTAAGKIPRHVAIIMDGNGRWARQKGNMR